MPHNHRRHHRCRRHRDYHNALPLNMATPGETVELVEIRGGHRLRKRLADLGLNIGMAIRIVQGDATGPMLLAFKGDARLAIGRGITHKIMVTPHHDPAHH
jgi:Fe2+ transport system protein FeoA